jgi:formylglycine-generating enzyme required for sulfatase activity
VWEWTLDIAVPRVDVPCTDCFAVGSGKRIVRGGAFSDYAHQLASRYLLEGTAARRSIFGGVRCARRP